MGSTLNSSITRTTSFSSSGYTATTSKRRITLFMNPAMVKHARAQAVVEDITLTNLVENALDRYLPKETVLKKVRVLNINKI